MATASHAQAPPALCTDVSVGAGLVTQPSTWTERDTQGQRLVREHGVLWGGVLSIAGRCDPVGWMLTLSQIDGSRAYGGVSSGSRAPLETTSRIREQTLALDLDWAPRLSSIGPGWWLLARGERLRIDRDIASVGSVLGYPERFDFWRAAVGVRWRAAVLAGGAIDLSGWIGGGPAGRLDIALPIADRTTLTTGAGRFTQWQAAWRWPSTDEPSARGWSTSVTYSGNRWQVGEGAEQLLWRAGTLVGTARQPATELRSHRVGLNWAYGF